MSVHGSAAAWPSSTIVCFKISLLQDIGVDRVAAMKEVSKPFWRG
jgi:hypothetical protein